MSSAVTSTRKARACACVRHAPWSGMAGDGTHSPVGENVQGRQWACGLDSRAAAVFRDQSQHSATSTQEPTTNAARPRDMCHTAMATTLAVRHVAKHWSRDRRQVSPACTCLKNASVDTEWALQAQASACTASGMSQKHRLAWSDANTLEMCKYR